MARIVIQNLYGKQIEVKDIEKPLLKHFHEQNLDWMHACGGKGRCTTCKVQVVTGADNFSAPTPAEQRYFKIKALKENERLACQAQITGDVKILIPDECKLPHIEYGE